MEETMPGSANSSGRQSKSDLDSSVAGKVKPKTSFKNKKNKKQSVWSSKAFKLNVYFALTVACGIVGYYGHRYCIYLPSLVSTVSDLPPVLDEDWSSVHRDPLRFWGTYRANLYVGFRARIPNSPLMGLMWFRQPHRGEIFIPNVRHWCEDDNNLQRYGWLEHDGESFGVQEIVDGGLKLKTTFVKQESNDLGGQWTWRIDSQTLPASNTSLYSFVVYFVVPSEGSSLSPVFDVSKGRSNHVIGMVGETKELGKFNVEISYPKKIFASNYLVSKATDVSVMSELIISSTGVMKVKSEHHDHYLGLVAPTSEDGSTVIKPNVIAVQLTVTGGTSFEIIYRISLPDKNPNLSGPAFDAELKAHRKRFEDKFESLFHLQQKQYPTMYVDVAKYALSNMLGSISYFHGHMAVQSTFTKKPVPYGPLTLFSGVPSRSFFPRGFLWDEGFHQLLLRHWDANLSLSIVASWLDLMNVEGWIPREVILGSEAVRKVPQEFIIQHNNVANPPMFFYLIDVMTTDKTFVEANRPLLQRIYPKLKMWFRWLNTTQAGKRPGTYRWHGRNATTNLELNPKALPSGLDDYPRASHPTDDEYHLDLYCWMAVSSRTMAKLSRMFNDSEALAKFDAMSKTLNDPRHLDSLHWSDRTSRYADYGLHTRNVKLETKTFVQNVDDTPSKHMSRTETKRVVLREPQLRLVTDAFGYLSLFPLFFRMIPHDSPKLEKVIKQMLDPDLLWTPFGLRSLAKTSPWYNKYNTEHDPPYWRGNIWVNMNFLAVSSLHYYSQQEGPYRDLAFDAYAKLRSAVVSNVVKEYHRTGYLWENYNDETGHGQRSHPFTGWTSLVLLMMSETYE